MEEKPAAQTLPDLTGKSRADAETVLRDEGFTEIAPLGSYRRWAHSDGSHVLIAPNGRVVRTGPLVRGSGKRTYRRRYNQQGEQIPFQPGGPDTHDTGESVVE